MVEGAFGALGACSTENFGKQSLADRAEPSSALHQALNDAWGAKSSCDAVAMNAAGAGQSSLPRFEDVRWGQPIQDGPPGVLDSLQGVPRSEVTVEGTVAQLLPDDTRGLPHERFIVQLGDGTDVFVAHDTSMAPHVPLTVGEPIEMKGEWIPEPKRYYGTDTIGVVHWTHHTDTPNHPGGWIEAGGQKYQ